ncbi:hypothetical protein [Vibrio splendidus]|uniref:hypothetical protein n=1 Tax=Vibrio TaxID=662 RepID=UPI00021C0BA8|nr:hypothetical protein [Vibrio splendidus]EGU40417.1 hypothetical protein VISP3789_19803 [Vibrio splendidus ATCC 33789]
MKIGLVISVYNKLEELEVLLNLSRICNFNEVLIVCENDAPLDDISKLKEKIPFDIEVVASTEFKSSDNKFEFYQSITPRVWEAQRKGIIRLAESVDYIMHTHSDGWILNKDFPLQLATKMMTENYDFAYRGVGITYQNPIGSPTGTIDDHFYMVSSKLVNKSLFIRKSLPDYLPGFFNIHGILSTWIISEVGVSNSFHYDDTREWLNWDGSNRNYKIGNPLRAYVKNEKLGLIHCHADDFPENAGKAIQANDLNKYRELADDPEISKFIEKYSANVDIKLLKHYEKLSKRLKMFGDFSDYHKNLAVMESNLKRYSNSKFKSIVRNVLFIIAKKVVRFLNLKLKTTLYPLKVSEVYNKYKVEYKNKEYNKIFNKIAD